MQISSKNITSFIPQLFEVYHKNVQSFEKHENETLDPKLFDQFPLCEHDVLGHIFGSKVSSSGGIDVKDLLKLRGQDNFKATYPESCNVSH
jgi:hypothetical protein